MSFPLPRLCGYLPLLSWASVLLACSTGERPVFELDGYSLRDSAGVRIMVNTVPVWGEGGGWRLTPEPHLIIGMVDGPEEYTFHRAASAVRLEDGRILVANQGSQEIRYYGPRGDFLKAVGSEGEGPGEFRGILFLWRLIPDSLAVLDYRLFRMSVFDLEGRFARTFRLGDGGQELPFPEGMFADGSALAAVHEGDQGDYTELGRFRETVQYRRYDREGRLMKELAVLPGRELLRGTHPDGSGYTTSPRYGLRVWIAVGPAFWVYGPAHAYEYQVWSLEGRLLKIVRLDRERPPPPPELIREREERMRDASPQAAEQMRAQPLPERLPAHEELILDRAGNLWMAEYRVPGEFHRYQVFDPDGRWQGGVDLPGGGRVTEIGDDYLLGVWTDDLGVEHVRMYGLIKPGEP